MNIYIHKILPLIASPLFLIFLIIFCGIIFNSKKINIIGIIILIFCYVISIHQKNYYSVYFKLR